MSNFLFLTDEFRAIGKEAQEAEQLTLLSPKAASVLIRSAMEKVGHKNDANLKSMLG